MQFVGPACVLDAYLFPAKTGGEAIVTYVDARLPVGRGHGPCLLRRGAQPARCGSVRELRPVRRNILPPARPPTPRVPSRPPRSQPAPHAHRAHPARPTPTPPRHAPPAIHRRATAASGAASAPSPLFPATIAALRTIRSRPIRLIGEPEKTCRNPASSSASRSATCGAASSARGAKARLACARRRELVPRADRQAIVAAIDMVADTGAHLARDRAAQLDGEVGDAAPRIDPIGRGEGAGRAGILAGVARSAGIARGRIGIELQLGEEHAQQQPAAMLAADEIGVLALPAEPGRLRQRLLHHRRGIDEHLELATALRHQPAGERLQRLLDDVVIVLALAHRPRYAPPRARRPAASDFPAGRSSCPAPPPSAPRATAPRESAASRRAPPSSPCRRARPRPAIARAARPAPDRRPPRHPARDEAEPRGFGLQAFGEGGIGHGVQIAAAARTPRDSHASIGRILSYSAG